jgi:hypothetical protein
VPIDCAQAAFARANELERDGNDTCVDLYYRSALDAWQRLESGDAPFAEGSDYPLAWQVYQQSLAGLIETGQRFRRLDARSHLLVWENGSRRIVPVAHQGFPWQPAEFCQLLPADAYRSKEISRYYRAPGLGVPLVALRVAELTRILRQHAWDAE